MDIADLKPGVIIKGNFWPEPVEVKQVSRVGDYIKILGSQIRSRTHVDRLMLPSEISSISIEQIRTTFASDARKAFLALEGKRYRYASLYDPLLAVNVSKVDPLPHQIDAVYGRILEFPQIRFMIADDPGAGKTIMAGLIIKELKVRNPSFKRVLLVVPGHLKDQWRREMKDRFEEHFVIVNRAYIDAHYGENVWEKESQIITSIDFAKQDDIMSSLTASSFDMVIVDEAHKMSAYRYGNKIDKKLRYKLGEALSKISDNLLFLTATPHRGDPENFILFLDLLQPGLIANTDILHESIMNNDNPLYIRRVKEEMCDFEGKPLFLPRHIQTLSLNLSESEKELYNEVSRYVQEQYNRALKSNKKRNVAFALVILQRRLASSTYALLRSLERRKERLTEILDNFEDSKKQSAKASDLADVDDLSEEERWQEEELWETLSVAENRWELEKEITTITSLIAKAKAIVKSGKERKLIELKDTLLKLNKEHPNKKILIFTESRDTLNYLKEKISEWGYSLNSIDGSMKLEERVAAESVFKNESQIMVATEAAGEGINLQFCNLMINYDLPWNPNRLEQRMGRIHRYGQKREVYVFNLVASDTREGQVLKRIFEKLDEIRRALGSDKVFDVISQVFEDKRLYQMMIEAAANERGVDEILKDFDGILVDEEYINGIKEKLGESLATRYIDYTRIKELAEKARECKLIPEYTEEFFRRAFELIGGRMRDRKDNLVAIESIPSELKEIATEDSFKRKFGTLLKEYRKVSFDKDVASNSEYTELVSFGHPLFEAVLEFIERSFEQEMKEGSVFMDPEGKMNGYILFYEGEINDGNGAIAGKRLFSFYVNNETVELVEPTILWDLKEMTAGEVDGSPIGRFKEFAEEASIKALETYRAELLKKRQKEAKIKRKYGTKSLDFRLTQVGEKLLDLEQRQLNGENVDLAVFNATKERERYEKASLELEDRLNREVSLSISMPRFVGIVKVIPLIEVSDVSGDFMQRDDEVERIAMQVSMDYERSKGRVPEDVSKEPVGYDVRSKDAEGNTLHIEVKGRATTGSVAITQNEWFKAKRFGEDFYLYVVFNTKTKPELIIIRNPAAKLKPMKKTEVVRYLVDKKQILSEGETV